MGLKLNSIRLIEDYIVRALLSSPDIPLDVNILRLADTDDKEGTVIFPKCITARFTGSNTQTVSTQPLTLSRTMDFELEISCQNQQSVSGHDYATYLLGACALSLLNKVPSNTGICVANPFTLEREAFSGLTESGHFVYTQTWSIVTEDVFPSISADPAIAKGSCEGNTWAKSVSSRGLALGEVLSGNSIYHLKPVDNTLDCKEFGGVTISENNDLVTVEDESVIYLTEAQITAGFQYIVKEIEGSPDILVTIRDNDGQIIRSDLFCATTLTLLELHVFGENNGSTPEKITTVSLPACKQAVITSNLASLFKDPTDTEEVPLQLRYGNLLFVDGEITLSVGEDTFTRAFLPDKGLYWIPEVIGYYRIISEGSCDE